MPSCDEIIGILESINAKIEALEVVKELLEAELSRQGAVQLVINEEA